MPHSVPIQYENLFEFLEDYRGAISQLQYTVPTRTLLRVGEDVAVQFMVPVLGESVTVYGQVAQSAEGMAAVQLDPDAGDGLPRLEGFYRFVGSLVEEMLMSGRFKVTGQWAEGAQPMAAGPASTGPSAAAAASSGHTPAGQQDLGVPTMQGTVDETSMTDVLMELYRSRATGVFEVKSETGRRLGWMKQGGFIQWENDPVIEDECLGVLLTRAGKLTEDQLKGSLRAMNETGNKQGECLIEMGALTFPQLVMSLMTQVEIVTRNVFAMKEGSWSFYPRDSLSSDFVTPPMKTPGFLFAYYKRRVGDMKPSERDRLQNPLMDQYTQLNPNVNWDDLRLKKIEMGLVEILRRKSYRYRALFSVSNMGRNQTVPVLLSLVKLGVLEFVATEDAEQVMERLRQQLVTKLNFQSEQNPFEALEIHWTSRTDQIKVSYDRMRKEYERFGRGVTLAADVEEKRLKILDNIDKAWEALKETSIRQETRKKHFEPQQHDFSADLLFRQGEMMMVRGQWREAIDDLERASELMPSIAKYRQMLNKAKAQSGQG